jgi:hypothetical protein
MNSTHTVLTSMGLNGMLSDTTIFVPMLVCAMFALLVCAMFVYSRNKKKDDSKEPLLPMHNDEGDTLTEKAIPKTSPRLFAICGQDVAQRDGALNVELRDKFLEVSSTGDYAIFAGTPPEKAVFLKGRTRLLHDWRFWSVPFTLYDLEGRIICVLNKHHSRRSIHNCVEVLWCLIGLESINLSSWTSVHGLMYDKSQCTRTSNIIWGGANYEDYIKNNTDKFREGPPLQQCLTNKIRLQAYWTKNGIDFEKLFIERSIEKNVVVTSSAMNTMKAIFTNVSECYHIGCADKQEVEKNLQFKWGAGFNYGDLCDLLLEEFTMDGDRQAGASNAIG